MDLATLFGMGKYTGYVWSSIGLTVLVLVLNVWTARNALADARAAARRALGRDGASEQPR